MIIGLNGKIGSGKDTIADFLVKEYGFAKIGYSDVLYDAVCALWGISLEEALDWKNNHGNSIDLVEINIDVTGDVRYSYTWREFLQLFGTEMGRRVFGEDFWIDQFNIKYLDGPTDEEFDALRYVVRDVRFNNEAQNVLDFGGHIWQVHRPGFEGDGHESESGIDPNFIRGDIGNDGTIDELYATLDEWMASVYSLNPV